MFKFSWIKIRIPLIDNTSILLKSYVIAVFYQRTHAQLSLYKQQKSGVTEKMCQPTLMEAISVSIARKSRETNLQTYVNVRCSNDIILHLLSFFWISVA